MWIKFTTSPSPSHSGNIEFHSSRCFRARQIAASPSSPASLYSIWYEGVYHESQEATTFTKTKRLTCYTTRTQDATTESPSLVMVVLNNDETDVMQLWSIITQLGEQLSQNQAMSVALYTTAGKVKVCFWSCRTSGF